MLAYRATRAVGLPATGDESSLRSFGGRLREPLFTRVDRRCCSLWPDRGRAETGLALPGRVRFQRTLHGCDSQTDSQRPRSGTDIGGRRRSWGRRRTSILSGRECHGMEEVRGSNPLSSTTSFLARGNWALNATDDQGSRWIWQSSCQPTGSSLDVSGSNLIPAGPWCVRSRRSVAWSEVPVARFGQKTSSFQKEVSRPARTAACVDAVRSQHALRTVAKHLERMCRRACRFRDPHVLTSVGASPTRAQRCARARSQPSAEALVAGSRTVEPTAATVQSG